MNNHNILGKHPYSMHGVHYKWTTVYCFNVPPIEQNCNQHSAPVQCTYTHSRKQRDSKEEKKGGREGGREERGSEVGCKG